MLEQKGSFGAFGKQQTKGTRQTELKCSSNDSFSIPPRPAQGGGAPAWMVTLDSCVLSVHQLFPFPLSRMA